MVGPHVGSVRDALGICPQEKRTMTKRLTGATRRSRVVGVALVASVAALACGDDPTGLDDGPSIVGTWTLDQSAIAVDSAGGFWPA
jgi:hypothetical protein